MRLQYVPAVACTLEAPIAEDQVQDLTACPALGDRLFHICPCFSEQGAMSRGSSGTQGVGKSRRKHRHE